MRHHGWTCPDCGRINHRFEVVCENCRFMKTFLQWLFARWNPAGYVVTPLVVAVITLLSVVADRMIP